MDFELIARTEPDLAQVLDRLAEEDIIGQLLRRDGKMRELGSEGGDPKLDWVDGVEKALQHPEWLAQCEQEAYDILKTGIRNIIWAGMGGSVQTVYVLKRMGLLDTPNLHVYPLDSTDPATLNRILREILANEKECNASGVANDRSGLAAALPRLLQRTMMIGVSMGMTSEEPITHLEWFDGLLDEAGIKDKSQHIQVMTLPGSYLDQFAKPRGCKMVPIQLDGENHTGGRFSAPATRVFIRPVTLRLIANEVSTNPGFSCSGSVLRQVLEITQHLYSLQHSMTKEDREKFVGANQFIKLATIIAERARTNQNQTALFTSLQWDGFAPWIEQLVEESLGKGGEGFLVLYGDQDWRSLSTHALPVTVVGGVMAVELALPPSIELKEQFGLLGALFASWKLTVATFGYLHDIVFAGQPAVEAYKAYARKFRDAPGEVPFPEVTARWESLSLHGAKTSSESAAEAVAEIINNARHNGLGKGNQLRYLDFTFNGEMTDELRAVFEDARRKLANEALKIPAKIRTGPSDYHSTEQSEVDGPNELISLRFVAMKHEAVIAGKYSDKFLLAQARGTWQAMQDAGRVALLISFPELNASAIEDLRSFFDEVARLVSAS